MFCNLHFSAACQICSTEMPASKHLNISFIRNTEIGSMKLNGGGWKSSDAVFTGPITQLNLEGTQTQVSWK